MGQGQRQRPMRTKGSFFECQVCVSTVADTKRFACPSCEYNVCKACQKMYMLPSCMSCRAEFTQRHMLDSLGPVFVNTVLRRHQEKLLMDWEKSLLPSSQESVDRVRAERENAARSRYGPVSRARIQAQEHMPRAPDARVPASLLCPVEACRGYVSTSNSTQWTCGICKVTLCPDCRVVVPAHARAGHVCNPDDLTSIALLQADSRSCPRCNVCIFRTEGCSHMHCTFCGADFNWDTGRCIKTTTNHHYNGVANISESIAQSASSCPDSFDEQDQELDVVPMDALNTEVADAELVTSLYNDLSVVRFTRGTLFRDAGSYEASLADLRVQFLMQEIDEARWTRRVFAVTKGRHRCEHLTRVLDMYISTARDFQRLLFRCVSNSESVVLKGTWLAFIGVCNQSLASLHSEFGGSLLTLRDRLDDPDQHPLLFQ